MFILLYTHLAAPLKITCFFTVQGKGLGHTVCEHYSINARHIYKLVLKFSGFICVLVSWTNSVLKGWRGMSVWMATHPTRRRML